ncbi:MAG: Gfo/Idh/MocA family protein [Halobacteriaceae archaeon]
MTYKVVGIDFSHLHMGDLLRLAERNEDAEIVGICDESDDPTLGLESTAREFGLTEDQIYRDHERCLDEADPDVAFLCPVPADHATWVENVAAAHDDCAIVLEKPFATSLEHADRMIEATEDRVFAINWPLAFYRTNRTAKRLVDEGRIGEVTEVHYYDGNRGSGRFTDVEYSEGGEMHFAAGEREDIAAAAESWWHQPEAGGGSLHDYMGYGTTLGTWYRDGELPTEVTCETFEPEWSEVDTHAVAIARYDTGLSKYETRWGCFTDPWFDQPQPKCGFVLVGTEGTISSYDYEDTIRVQDEDNPGGYEVEVDELDAPNQDVLQHVVHCLDTGEDVSFPPLTPSLCRKGQRIVDTAVASAERGGPVDLLDR